MGGFSRPAPPPAPTPKKAEVSQATTTDATAIMRGKGRSSTILTGARGLGDNSLTTTKKSLLG